MRTVPWKARLLTVAVIVSNVGGNLLLSAGMKSAPDFIQAVLSPFVFAGVALLIFWLVSRMTLMSWADLSYVIPVTAAGYVLSTACAALLLHEHVSAMRWLATLLIVAGTIVAGTTPHKTTPEPRP
jgi:uncharacterized membrane protein